MSRMVFGDDEFYKNIGQIDVLYLLFKYLKKLKDTKPHGRTVWALSFVGKYMLQFVKPMSQIIFD